MTPQLSRITHPDFLSKQPMVTLQFTCEKSSAWPEQISSSQHAAWALLQDGRTPPHHLIMLPLRYNYPRMSLSLSFNTQKKWKKRASYNHIHSVHPSLTSLWWCFSMLLWFNINSSYRKGCTWREVEHTNARYDSVSWKGRVTGRV